MFENLKYSNDKILDTIFWSLGGIAVAIFAVLGTNIYFNKNKFEYLSREVERNTEKFEADLTQNINSYVCTTMDGLQSNLINKFNNLSESNKQQIKTFSEEFISRIEILKKNIDKNNISIYENINQNKKIAEENAKKLKASILENEADIWYISKVYSNAMTRIIKLIYIEKEIKAPHDHSLGKLIEIVSNCNSLTSYEQSDLNNILISLPSTYDLQKEKLRSIIKSIVMNNKI